MKSIIIRVISSIIVICLCFFVYTFFFKKDNVPEILTQSTLERIIDINELSTFKSVYIGVTEVMNENNPENTDYYVYYESVVKAGIDFKDIDFSIDHESASVMIEIPEVFITEITVDIASLDYIFINSSANKLTVTEEAYAACIEDVTTEANNEESIKNIAKETAKNTIIALISPFIEQLDGNYTLEFMGEK